MNSKFILSLCILAIARAQDGYSRDNPNNQLRYDASAQDYDGEDGGANGGEIPGEAGQDYPVYSEVPQTSFSCGDHQFPGYYADPEAQCQVFYVCQKGGKSDSFLCPNGTLFNQGNLVCDWWYNFECSRAESLYSVNEQVVLAMEEADARLAQQGYSSAQSGNHDSSASYASPSANGNGNGHDNSNHRGNGNANGNINGNGKHSVNGNSHNDDGHFSNGNGLSPKPEYGVPASAPKGISNERYNNAANGNGNGAHTNGNEQKNGFHGIANGNGNAQYQSGNKNFNGNEDHKNGNGNGQTNGFHGITNGNKNQLSPKSEYGVPSSAPQKISNERYSNGANGNDNGAHENRNEQKNGFHGIGIESGNGQYQNGNANRAHKNENVNRQTNEFHGIPNGNGNDQYQDGNEYGNINGAYENGNGSGHNGKAPFSNGNKKGNGMSPKPEYGVPASATQRISNERHSNGNVAHENGNGNELNNGFHNIANGNQNDQYENGNVNGNTITYPNNNFLTPGAGALQNDINNFSEGSTFQKGVSTPEKVILPPTGNNIHDEAEPDNGENSFNNNGPSVQGNVKVPERSYLPALQRN